MTIEVRFCDGIYRQARIVGLPLSVWFGFCVLQDAYF